MLRKLQQDVDVYDATCLVVGEWSDPPAFDGVVLRHDLVPADLAARRLLATLIGRVLDRTPVDMHVDVRATRARRPLPIHEVDEAGDDGGKD